MRKSLVLMAVALALVAGACTRSTRAAIPPPDHPLWACGDSLAFEMALAMQSRPHLCGGGGTGFNEFAPNGEILDAVVAQLDDGGPWQPELMLALGGTNGAVDTTVEDQIDGMIEFEAAMQARGIPVRWVASPAKAYAPLVDPLSDWLLANRPDTIDCRQHALSFRDNIHLSKQSNAYFAGCVNGALPEHLQTPPG